jgi:hypothetical protein
MSGTQKQPKFKFGDKVFGKDGVLFMVRSIHLNDQKEFEYSGSVDSKYFRESSLDLVPELIKPRKLVAHENPSTGELFWSIEDSEICRRRDFSLSFRRLTTNVEEGLK